MPFPPSTGLLRPMAAMLLLAAVLGLAYNGLSPLGVRLASESGSAAAPDHALPADTLAIAAPPALLSTTKTNAPAVRTVTWKELEPRLPAGGLLLIDVRPAASYQSDHIPGAISIPPETSAEDLLKLMGPYPKNQPIVLYCESPSCHMSRALAQHLITLGFSDVQDFEGGMAEYVRSRKR